MADTFKIKRIAAVGDIHVRENDQGKWVEFFRQVSEIADVLLLCGDLTDTGHLVEAEILAEEIKACTIPVIGVLGNHDYERNHQREIKKIMEAVKVHMLDGEAIILGGVGFAGAKGFGGGFDRYALSMFGEDMFKKFVQETVDETLKLDRALNQLESEHPEVVKIVLLHYAPIKDTIEGEPEQIFPFMGSSRLVEPLETRQALAAFHGHAHIGKIEGQTSKGVKVFNVSKPVLEKAGLTPSVYLFDLEEKN